MTDTISNYPLALSIIVALPLFGVAAKLFGVSFKRLAKWYLYVAVFAVVVVLNSIFFPFIGGKDYFFRFAIQLSLICAIFWWAFEARAGELGELFASRAKKPLFIAVSAFVAVFLLASLFAYDVNAAFWSNYERGEGGFQMIHYYIFFVLLIFFLRTEDDWKNIFRFSLVAAGGMILYGVLANLGTNGLISQYSGGGKVPQDWLHKLIDARFQGSLGNPAYVAPYLLFSMFYAAYLWISRKISGRTTTATATAWGYGILIAIFLFFFILSQTRGAFLGLGAGALTFVLYLAVVGHRSIRKWSSVGLIIIILCGIGIFAFRNASFVQDLPMGRLLQVNVSDPAAQARFWTWGSAWRGFLERPILGWGPENFTAVFDKYFDPRHFVPGQRTETWFDRAHSVFFDYLSETGILGFISYLSIFAVFAWEFFMKGRRPASMASAQADGNSTTILKHGLILALPVAYLVQGIAIFDVLPMYLNLFLFAAFAYHYFYEKHGPNS